VADEARPDRHIGAVAGAGGAAAVLMSLTGQPPAPPPPIATVEILVAKADIEAGLKLTPDKVQCRGGLRRRSFPNTFGKQILQPS
jgi:Flp pilus assembly protein CpaB